ncbi:pentapeptide repeat-containing protein [Rhizobiaceae bacterium n13]|uniref:Pentapeptide repeat-containing protein n=1 Tax=Ferirhizobium litorale TaxID=2927786 RepID=A0AAE3U1G5_9HYPH|nr:pentapeptide repeat-containing protein [Fererhizobium litorale]MDI7863362.1 pentapeptide repeat-containing protein [Fererhizobium litorale]MDI7922361.1 pentapeptide repeat-containing protein [Fererhizobium litorale]
MPPQIALTRGHAQAAIVAAALWALPNLPAAAADCSSPPGPGVNWEECTKKHLMLPGSNFERANLAGADLSVTDLGKTNMTSANLEKAALQRAWFTGAKLDNANFSRVEAYRTGFVRVAAAGANFSNAELQRADFREAYLKGANFSKAELGRANFQGATLTNTRFSYANLSRADFTTSIFEGPLQLDHAFLFLTRIEGLDLSTSLGLEQDQINLACGDAKTKLPDGLVAPRTWPCPFD